MEASYSDLIGDVKDSFDVGIFETNTLNIGYERAKEVVEQQLFRLLDQCFWDFPCLNTDLIQKTIGELNSFLNLHKIEQDSQLIEYINKHLHQAIQEYPWNEIIYKR